jgi:hypothetical protein
VAETSGLLNRRTGDSRTEGSNPSVSANRLSANVRDMSHQGSECLVSGSGATWAAGVSLASPQSITGWPAVANDAQTRSLSVKLDTAATIAGTYTDTITASVTPN